MKTKSIATMENSSTAKIQAKVLARNKSSEQEDYIDDTNFGSEVIKRSPNLVAIDLDENSDNDYDDDLDDHEDTE
jgi:hypothetical protein